MDGYASGWVPGQTRAGPEMDSTRERKLGGEGNKLKRTLLKTLTLIGMAAGIWGGEI